MPAPAEVALAHAAQRRAMVLAVADDARDLWSRIDPARIAQTWAAQVSRLLLVLTASQRVVAGKADTYLDDILDAQHIDTAATARTMPATLAGVASDGRTLDTLLYQPAITALTGIQRGAGTERSLASGYAHLDMIVRTQVADAGRVADQVATAARPRATGYVRMLVGRSCSRCALLAGRWYAYNAGFQRHPRCLPAGVVVSGPAVDAATRRFYEGELVVLATASGQKLPITGNHPVLTDRGWVPANLVEEGGYVVRSTRPQGASPLVIPDEHQVPSSIEDLWRPDGVMPLLQMPTTAEDFHGDGGHGDVDVVLSDRLLRNRSQASFAQEAFHEFVAGRVVGPSLLPLFGACDQEFLGVPPTAIRSFVRRLRDENPTTLVGLGADSPCRFRAPHLSGAPSLTAALLGGHPGSSDPPGFGHSSDLDPGFFESFANRSPGDFETLTHAVFAFARQIGSDDFGVRQDTVGSRWDPPGDPFAMQSRMAYASRGQDLLLRLSGQVELDRVVAVRKVEWSGHVYNLSSVEGWYSANGLIVSNCDCIGVPGRESVTGDIATDPKAFFRSLSSAEQDRVFGQAGAQAIRLGADISKVVNARRGITTADALGRRVQATTEARAGRRVRLMPETILREAGSRDEALRLLRLHGYIR